MHHVWCYVFVKVGVCAQTVMNQLASNVVCAKPWFECSHRVEYSDAPANGWLRNLALREILEKRGNLFEKHQGINATHEKHKHT